LRVCAPCHGRSRLDVARGRSGAAAVCVRPRASIRGRPASRRRSRRPERQPCARPGEGNRLVRGDGADRRQDCVDRDGARLHRHARPPRVDRRGARGARGRRLGRRDGWAERRDRLAGALRLLRYARDERSAGIRRSADRTAFARGACALAGRRACGRRRSSGNSRSGAGGDAWPVAGKRAERQFGTKPGREPGSVSTGGGGDPADDCDRPSEDASARELASCSRRGCARVQDAGETGRGACPLARDRRSGDAAG
jgi:hypothetical protein